MEYYCITSHMYAKKDCAEKFSGLLVEYEKACAEHAGLIWHSIQRNRDDPQDFIFFEVYDSEQHLLEHRAQPIHKTWAPVRDKHIEWRKVNTWQMLHAEGSAVSALLQKNS